MSAPRLPELIELNRLLDQAPADAVGARGMHTVQEGRDEALPIHVLTLGNPDPDPAGHWLLRRRIHGLERIGTRVLLVYLRGSAEPTGAGILCCIGNWKCCAWCSCPLVNPGRHAGATRAAIRPASTSCATRRSMRKESCAVLPRWPTA
jgi:hypothetical protein